MLALLEHKDLSFDLLAGHSKGNLVIAEALYALKERKEKRAAALAKVAKVVTVSARIAMPEGFEVIDVMGKLDWFGALNSRWNITPDDVVPLAWHHTNTELPYHLPVTKVMRRLLAA